MNYYLFDIPFGSHAVGAVYIIGTWTLLKRNICIFMWLKQLYKKESDENLI